MLAHRLALLLLEMLRDKLFLDHLLSVLLAFVLVLHHQERLRELLLLVGDTVLRAHLVELRIARDVGLILLHE